MKCKVCGAESGKYPLCRACNIKKEQGEIIKCDKCGSWHYIDKPCVSAAEPAQSSEFLYDLKKRLITQNESLYYAAIKNSVPDGYSVFPQINLATFIEKNGDARYRTELFRNVDFLIVDEEFCPKIAIEINDRSHLTSERRERDEKVKNICEEAGIPLLRFWTSYGVNEQYISGKITETLNAPPCERISHFGKQENEIPAPNTDAAHPVPENNLIEKKGCYIATCVYGSYNCPQVWVLRRYRDEYLEKTIFGRLFIKFYYAVSPVIVKLFGDKAFFTSFWKNRLDAKVSKLREAGYDDTPYAD